jgi:hypothetical protein
MTECIICGSTDIIQEEAGIAPFIAEYVFDNAEPSTNMARCEVCGFSWFTYRMTKDECKRLYRRYRSEQYQVARQKHEPNYTKKLNEFIGHDKIELSLRERFMQDIIGYMTMVSVLDYGGGEGQNIPKQAYFKYVHEMSDVKQVKGVQAWNGTTPSYFDLVLCTHVLEHVPDPWGLVNELRSLGKKIYIEVPYTTENKFGAKPIMHEHVNFFTPRSLSLLTGVPPSKIHCRELDLDWGRVKIMGALIE